MVCPHHYTLSSVTAEIFVYFVHCHILNDFQDEKLAQDQACIFFFDELL